MSDEPPTKPAPGHLPGVPPESDNSTTVPQISGAHVLKLAIVVEGGLVILGLALAFLFGLFDHRQPLREIDSKHWQIALFWGLIGTLPMLVYLWVAVNVPLKFLKPMMDFVEQNLRPMFQKSGLLELAIISLLAGFCEELMFRWCLQGGISHLTDSPWIGVAIASLAFGLCHWVNTAYGVTTTIIGAYLGCMMILTGTWLAPAVAHTLFDFIALVYVTRARSNELG